MPGVARPLFCAAVLGLVISILIAQLISAGWLRALERHKAQPPPSCWRPGEQQLTDNISENSKSDGIRINNTLSSLRPGDVPREMAHEKGKPRFRKIQSFDTDYAPATITRYESETSGMQVIVADRKGPKVNGYFTLATEIFDDSGAPHTLEHLVFMGSRNYQYKGLLDKLASRAYSWTNAWTATDHTAYTLDTAGWEGFAQILPVYLEHVVLPNLTDEACLTEVHHVDGEGNDAGVVYSEMQALQHSSNELMDLRARRLLYPENVGFRYETGGMMEALRVLTPERIREFHRAMYQPRNLAVIIVGEVDHQNLLEILDEFDQSIKDSVPALDSPFKRPWIDSAQPPALKATVVETVEFPEDDESVGEILIGFFGPSCTDVINSLALGVLLTYLCGSSVSILENVIVEKEELASSVSYWWDSRPNSVVWLQPTGVATEKLSLVEQRVFSLLQETASKPLDMAYMKECIRREKRQVKSQAEGSETFYSTNLINDFLFGKRDGSDLLSLKTLEEYDVVDAWTDEQWREFLRKWMADAHHVSILGKPSAELASQLKAAEKDRVAKRKDELGADGLKKLQDALDAAKQKNEQPIPESVIDQWDVPGTDSIHFIESLTARSGKARDLGVLDNEAQRIIDKAAPGPPLFLQFEDVPSNFVLFTIHLGTSQVPVKLKPLLTLWMDIFFNSPITRDGKRIEFEEVVKELEKDTIQYSLTSGRDIGDSEGIMIQFRTEPDKYGTIVRWIRELMLDSIFDPPRLKAAIAKALADIPESKRDGRQMSLEVEMAIRMVKDSFSVSKRTLVKAVYLKRLKKLLETDPQTVVSWFEELRRSLFTFQNLRILVTANVSQLDAPVATWDDLASRLGGSSSSPPPDVLPVVRPFSLLSDEGRKPGGVGAILIPMTTLDSSYSVSTTTGFTSFADPRLPAFLVAIGYLDAVEGPLWNAVRGNGLAYGVSFSRDADGGFLQYRVYRSPDAFKAIEASRAAVDAAASGRVPLDKHLVQGAVSGIVTGFADDQATMASAAQQNFMLAAIRGLPLDWAHKIMKAVRDVTNDEIRAAMADLIMPVFTPGTSNVVVTCAPLMQESMEKAFKAMGYKTQTQTLSHFYDDYGLEGDDGEDDDDDDEDDEEGEDEDGSGDGSEEDEHA